MSVMAGVVNIRVASVSLLGDSSEASNQSKIQVETEGQCIRQALYTTLLE